MSVALAAGGEEAAALQGEIDALVKQLADEAELASATLDRAEAAERELASLRSQLDERQARICLYVALLPRRASGFHSASACLDLGRSRALLQFALNPRLLLLLLP